MKAELKITVTAQRYAPPAGLERRREPPAPSLPIRWWTRVVRLLASAATLTSLALGQVELVPDTAVVTRSSTGLTVTTDTIGTATISGFGTVGTVELRLPSPLPAGTADQGSIVFPTRASVQIRQTWSVGAPFVSIERTATGRCTTNLDVRDCSLDFLEVENLGGVRRAYVDAQIDLGLQRTATVRFRWMIKSSVLGADNIRIVGAAPPGGQNLAWGTKQTFRARIRYTLLSRSTALVALRIFDRADGGNLLASSDFVRRSRTPPSGEEIPTPLEIADFEVPQSLREVYLHAVLIDDFNPGVLARFPERYAIPEVKLSISSVEVVQVAQTADNKVPLVAGAQGLIRAFIKQEPDDPRISGVTGRALLDGKPLDRVGASTAAHASPDRNNPGHSLNFHFRTRDNRASQEPLQVWLDEAPGEEYSVEHGERNQKGLSLNFEEPLTTGLRVSIQRACVLVDGKSTCGTPPVGARLTPQQLFPISPDRLDISSRYHSLRYPGEITASDESKRKEQHNHFLNFLRRVRDKQRDPPDMLIGAIERSLNLDGVTGTADPPWRGMNRGRVAFIKENNVPLTAGMNLAHEMAHNMGLHHTNTSDACLGMALDGKSNWSAFYTDASGSIHDPGYDAKNRKIVSRGNFDLMTYCSPETKWLSPFHYSQLIRQLRQFSSSRQFVLIDDIQPLPGGGVSAIPASAPPKDRALSGRRADPVRPPRSVDPVPSIVVSGWANRDGTAGGLDPVLHVQSLAPADINEPAGGHCVEFHGPAAKLSEFCFGLSFDSQEDGTPLDRDFFTILVPAPEELARVILRRGESALAELSASLPPSIQIDRPQPGERFEGPLTLSWTSSQPEGKELSYEVEFSRDGENWSTLGLDLKETSLTIDSMEFEQAGAYQFRVTSTCGLTTASAIVGPIEISQLPRMEVPERTVSFGQVPRGGRETRPLTVRATGTGPVAIQEASFSSPVFSLEETLPLLIPAGAEVDLPIALDTTTPGRYAGTMTLVSDASDAESVEIRLEATVADPPGAGGNEGGGGSSGTGGTTPGGTDVGSQRISPLAARGWPNERSFDNPPANALDGNTSTFTWTTEPFNTQSPSYFGVDFGASKPVSRIRIFKDNDGGGGTRSDQFKNLVIEYTTTSGSTPLASRTWARVSGLVNGFQGTELLTAGSVNADGTVTRDSHNSLTSGWASLTFTAVNATGVRIGFSNVTDPLFFNHYKIHEFEAYGPAGSTAVPGGGTITGIEFRNGGLSNGVFRTGGQVWDTLPTGANILGVSLPDAGATLLNNPQTKAIRVSGGSYYTYIEPAIIGTHLQVTVKWAEGRPDDVAVFAVGPAGPAGPWERVSGSTALSLASTGLNMDKVSSGFGPNGTPDQVLRLTAGTGGAGGGGSSAIPLRFDPASLSWEAAEAGQQKPVRAVNPNSETVTITRITSSNPSFVVTTAVPAPTGPGSFNNVVIRFTPTGPGQQTGVIRVETEPAAAGGEFRATGAGAGSGGGSSGTTSRVVQVDDGSVDLALGFNQGGVQGYFVNRLTPASYPATLRKVILFFVPSGPPLNGLPLGSAIQLLSGTVTSGASQLSGLTFTRTNATVTAFNNFVEFDVPPITVQSGSFVVGFTVANPPGVLPAAVDTSSMSARRSYVSSDGLNFFLLDEIQGVGPGNLMIRARVDQPDGAAPSTRINATQVAAWPNGRTADNVPGNAIDGNTATFTWTTAAFNNVNPSYLGVGFAAPSAVNRIRLYKDADSGGAGLLAKDLTIEYTASPASAPLASRTWTRVTGLVNGFRGSEQMSASSVNADGTVTGDSHDSTRNGWASLTFDAVNATGLRIGFSNAAPLSMNHYRVYEFEAYGVDSAISSSGGTIARTVALR
ncbi:MAG: hypothetical protein R2762_17125 [Bryobacteraceae bacterium]